MVSVIFGRGTQALAVTARAWLNSDVLFCGSVAVTNWPTGSATGKSMRIGEHDALARAHRARASDPDFITSYRQHRPMVERSLAWLTRGNRKLRYRGTAKNNAWLHLRAGAINLRRLTALGLQRTDGAWTIA